MGIGIAEGEGRAVEAVKQAISSPLLETSIDGAQGVIMNITGGSDLSLYEVQEAADIVTSATDEELNMIFGSIINENLKNKIIVTVIATGFEKQEEPPLKISTRSSKERRTHSLLDRHHKDSHPQQRQETVQKDRRRQPSKEDLFEVPTFLRNRRSN